MIQAPYRFVEANRFAEEKNEIFYPSWGNYQGNDIRFDMPYKDSKSGEIKITLTAKSPIFVGDFTHKDENKREFFNHKGVYYIPGSSIKGMIRRIVAILSFSKMSLEDRTLSYRDLNNPSYQIKAMDQNKIFMGWLYKKSEKWFIQEVGNVTKSQCRISYQQMKEYLKENLVSEIKTKREAYKKYEIIHNHTLEIQEGTIVFTGSAGDKKTREFIFPNTLLEIYELTNEQIQNFKEAYYIGTSNESKDWKNLWGKKFDEGEKIPVFFQKDSKNKVLHFGLSMLYKLPYENSIGTLYKKSIKNYNESYLDCTERIFGYVKENSALKGRISFSHFKAQGEIKKCQPETLILSSPRPTFYPFYLQQTPNTLFKNYDDEDAKLSGFKFYVPKHQIMPSANTSNVKIKTTITPLEKETKFVGKLRYFNLRKEELGLLLLSLTFLKGEHFYKIGGAKPYGYGDCHLDLELPTDIKPEDCINAYIDFVKKEFNGKNPKESKSAKDLLQVSKKIPDDKDLQYLEVKNFAHIKNKNKKNMANPATIKSTIQIKKPFHSPFDSPKNR